MAGSQVPLDLLVEFACFGGASLAVPLGQSCRKMKELLKRRWDSPRVLRIYERNLVCKEITTGQDKHYVDKLQLPVATVRSSIGNFAKVVIEESASKILDILSVPSFQFCRVKDLSVNGHVRYGTIIPSTVETLDMCISMEAPRYRAWHSIFAAPGGIQFPQKLKDLAFRCFFDDELSLSLPDGLERLDASAHYLAKMQLPPSLRILHCMWCDVALPDSLEELYIYSGKGRDGLRNIKFPPRLRKMVLPRGYKGPVPDSLVSVWSTVEELIGFTGYSVPLPSSIKKLTIGRFADQIRGPCLPEGLLELTFADEYYKSVDELILPASLKKLKFGHHFNQCIASLQLPQGLEVVVFGKRFTQSLQHKRWPSSLRLLCIANPVWRHEHLLQLPKGAKLTIDKLLASY